MTQKTSLLQRLLSEGDKHFAQHNIKAAIASAKKMLKLDANSITALRLLAACYHHKKNYLAAIEIHKKLLTLTNPTAEDYFNLGYLCNTQEELTAAEQYSLEGLKIAPDHFVGLENLASTYVKQELPFKAMEIFERMMQLYPTQLTESIYKRIGIVGTETYHYKTALAAFFQLIERWPDIKNIHLIYHDIGLCHYSLGNFTESLYYFEKAMALHEQAEFHKNYGFLLIAMRQYERGWKEHEFRLFLEENDYDAANYNSPYWDGSDLNHKILLVCCEQGFGDNIQFVRFLKIVKQRFPQVTITLQSRPALVTLFEQLPEIDSIFITPATSVVHDFHVSLLSLPYYLRIHHEPDLMPQPYLAADATLVAKYDSLFEHSKKFKIGICWAGNPVYRHTTRRNTQLEKFLFITQLPNVSLFSLQKDLTDAEKELLTQHAIPTLAKDTHDFADTAAIISKLDLIITVDTAVAHLAGAMGKPVWVVLSAFVEWRHSIDRDTSAWYQQMHLIRQTVERDWDSAFVLVKQRLAKILATVDHTAT